MSKEHIRPTKLHCLIGFTIILFIGIIALICCLALRPHKPKFELHNFAILGLDRANGFESTKIFFNVSVKNPNRRLKITYETFSAAVYYRGEQIGSTPSFGPFDEGPENTTYIFHVLTGGVMAGKYSGQPWPMAVATDRAKGAVEFRLELDSKIRYRKTILDLKKHRLHPKCHVLVGSDGVLVSSYANKKCSL
ncbi:NDR1/HIN1-like protein 10 [Linum grandiflorum]